MLMHKVSMRMLVNVEVPGAIDEVDAKEIATIMMHHMHNVKYCEMEKLRVTNVSKVPTGFECAKCQGLLEVRDSRSRRYVVNRYDGSYGLRELKSTNSVNCIECGTRSPYRIDWVKNELKL